MLRPEYKVEPHLSNSQGRKNLQLCTTSRKHDNKNGQPQGNTSESPHTSQSTHWDTVEKDSTSFCGFSEGITTKSGVIAGIVGGVCAPNALVNPIIAGALTDEGDGEDTV